MKAVLAAVLVLPAALILQLAFSVRVDEDEDQSPGSASASSGSGSGSGSAAAAIKAAQDAKAVDAAKKVAAEAAAGVAAAVSVQQQDAAKAAGPPEVMVPPPKQPPMTAPVKPAIVFEKEQHPLMQVLQKDGLTSYDLDGNAELDTKEFREVVHDLSPTDPIATSDAEMERLLKTYDKDHTDSLNREEVMDFLAANPTSIARLDVDVAACSGWSPKDGPSAGLGAFCKKWGWQKSWCFVEKDYKGAGEGRVEESDFYKGKFFAPCVPPAVPASSPTMPPTAAPDVAVEKAKEALEAAAAVMKEAAGEVAAAGQYSYEYDYV